MPGGWLTWTVLLVVVDFVFIMLIFRMTLGQIFRALSTKYPAVEVGKRRGRYRKAKIGATTLWGLAWAFDLADAGDDAN